MRLAAVLTLALLALDGGPAAAQAGGGLSGFVQTHGLAEASRMTSSLGPTTVTYQPGPASRGRYRMTLSIDGGGRTTAVELTVERAFLDRDRVAASAVVGHFLRAAFEGDPANRIGSLVALVEEPDADRRAGASPVSMGCCALPPSAPRDAAAVAVVDGLRDYALVRNGAAPVRFRNVEAPGGGAALSVTVSNADPPERVVEAVFESARHGDPSWLGDLCHAGATDEVAELCRTDSSSDRWDGFVETFRSGRVAAPAEIEGTRARVPFRFGPDGDRVRVMELRRVDGRWFLAALGAGSYSSRNAPTGSSRLARRAGR